MAKGIKKIEWTEKEKIVSNRSTANVKATIEADQFVHFKITEWYDGTTVEEKKGNVLWHFQTHTPRASVIKTTKKSSEPYGIKLPKKLCGIFPYYLQTSLPNVTHSKSAGLAIVGWCEPRIISSAWATKTNGEDVRLSHNFNFGNPVYLHLATEGLNGYNDVIIEIHRRVKGGKGTEDDQLIKVYTKASVINGEVNLVFNDTLSWYGVIKDKIEIEQFYIKVKSPSLKKYIKDNNNDIYHGRYLRIKNKKEHIIPKVETGLSKLKVGPGKKYEKNAGSCKFKKIGITYNGDSDLIFDEGKFIRVVNPDDNFNTLEKIHYDYDKWEIRSDAKPILDKIAVYLKEPPLLPVELGAHTDIRGTDEYNMELSAKRADSVVNYLISKGVGSNLISAKGYGKTKLINKGDNISEELHQENRRTTLRFKLFGNNAQTLVHDVIVPSYKKPSQLKINIDGFIRKGCHRPKEHKNEIKSYDGYEQLDAHPLKDGDNSIDVQLHSRTPTTPKITDIFSFTTEYRNIYRYYLHSCTYYSMADREHPTFAINAYPDIVWIFHFQYNYTHQEEEDKTPKEPYYFHSKKLDLKHGIEQEINEITESKFSFIANFFPGGWLAKEVFLPYVQKKAMIYDVGLHAIYDRNIEKKEEELSLVGTQRDFIKADNTTRYIVGFVIYELVAIGIIIDLLMIYLTRGKNLEGRLARIASKVKKVSKYLDDAGAELVPPSIAVNAGMYYKMQEDKRLALIYEANIKADPLVAINFEKKYNLGELIKNKTQNKDNQKKKKLIAGVIEKIGDGITATLTMKGEITMEQNVQYNVLTEQYTFNDKLINFAQKNITTYSSKITGTIVLEGSFSKKFFEFSPLETKVDGKITLDMACEAVVITQYGFDKKGGKGLYMEQKLKFSGLKGTFKGSIDVHVKDREPIGYSSNEGKPIPFTLLEADTYTLNTIYFFNTKSQK